MAVKNTLFRQIDAPTFEGNVRSTTLWIRLIQAGLLVSVGLLLLLPVPVFGGTVTVSPGSNVPVIVQNSPSGTTFQFAAGVYQLSQPIVPKDHDVFVGASGFATTLRGSIVVSSFTTQGTLHVATFPDNYSNEVCSTRGCDCLPGHPGCNLSEELFFDQKVWQRVTSLSAVGPGKWYWDLGAGKIYLADNPAGHQVRVSVVSQAFAGAANSVTIKGFVIREFADHGIYAKITGGQWSDSWIIENNRLQFNHLSGLTIANGTQVLNNTICDNGKVGIDGGGEYVLIQGNELCRNNYAGFSGGRGGLKTDKTIGLVIRSNYVHDNLGVGMHVDGGALNTLYEYNHTKHNQGAGIDHEISHAAIIRYNLVENDAFDPTGTSVAHGAGIWIYASDNVDVYGNTVTNSMNGIAGYQNLRNDNLGTHYLTHLSVHDNSITQQSGASAGILTNTDPHYYPMIFTSWSNYFDNNIYCLTDSSAPSYDWNLETVAKTTWQSTFKGDVHSVWTCPAPATTTTGPGTPPPPTSGGEPSLVGHTVSGSKTGTTQILQVTFSNTGSGTASNVSITKVQVKTTGGTGTVTYLSPALPISVGNIPAGGSATVSLSFLVPSTVTYFTITETGTMEDDAGTTVPFSSTQYKS
jgi:hypothetical protein